MGASWDAVLAAARAHRAPVWWGIVNATPDSFSDGGRNAAEAVAWGRELVRAGAAALDVGGESTRPGWRPVHWREEWRRLEPVLAGLRDVAPLSVDTRKASILRRAEAAVGPVCANDVNGLAGGGVLSFAAAAPGPVVLMHGMAHRLRPDEPDPAGAVRDWFARRLDALSRAGIPLSRVILDPGIGFGTTRPQDVALLERLDRFLSLGCVLAVGLSRKRVVRECLSRPGESPDAASARASLSAFRSGVSLLRVHVLPA
ncbi:MAG: dihydropteroate synthase [Kiritimatiellae bacterium]|nr:dihydropteroate synthase [Kiritimatiellia bacterium]